MVEFKRSVGLITLECFRNKLLTSKTMFWTAWDTLSGMMIISSFYKFLVAVDGICDNNLFQPSVFSETWNEKCAKDFSATLICL